MVAMPGPIRAATCLLALLLTACGGDDQPPVAVDDGFTVSATQPNLLDVLANDRDPENGALTLAVTRQPPGAQARVAGTRIEITPSPGAYGPTDFAYRISDPSGATAEATVRVVLGSAAPLFHLSAEGGDGIRLLRHDFLSTTAIALPVPSGEYLDAVLPSADGRRLVYLTRSSTPTRHRLWVRELGDLAAPIREIATPPGLPADLSSDSAGLSADGRHGVFGHLAVSLDAPGQVWDLGAALASVRFTRDGDRFYYVTQVTGGTARVVRRATFGPSGVTTEPITAAPAGGTGVTDGIHLSPDETLLLTQRFISIAGRHELRVYLTPTDGSGPDRALTDLSVPANEFAAGFTPDGKHLAFESRSAAGNEIRTSAHPFTTWTTAIRAPAGQYTASPLFAADSRTFFFVLSGQDTLAVPSRWNQARLDQPGFSAPYLPTLNPQSLRVAPDAQSLVFSEGGRWHGVAGPAFDTPRVLHAENPLQNPVVVGHSPDSRVFAVAGRTTASAAPLERSVLLLNPAIPAWSRQFVFVDAADTRSSRLRCVTWPGRPCVAESIAQPTGLH